MAPPAKAHCGRATRTQSASSQFLPKLASDCSPMPSRLFRRTAVVLRPTAEPIAKQKVPPSQWQVSRRILRLSPFSGRLPRQMEAPHLLPVLLAFPPHDLHRAPAGLALRFAPHFVTILAWRTSSTRRRLDLLAALPNLESCLRICRPPRISLQEVAAPSLEPSASLPALRKTQPDFLRRRPEMFPSSQQRVEAMPDAATPGATRTTASRQLLSPGPAPTSARIRAIAKSPTRPVPVCESGTPAQSFPVPRSSLPRDFPR